MLRSKARFVRETKHSQNYGPEKISIAECAECVAMVVVVVKPKRGQIEVAKKWCTEKIISCQKLQTPDQAALKGVKDMVKIGNTADGKATTLKTACDLVKEDG